jgi:hypothetical protein
MKEALKNSRQFDELYTPEYAVEPVLKYIPADVKTIWCPCDTNESKVVQKLQRAGYDVYFTHIECGFDFLKTNIDCDMIITNPPYSTKDKMLARAYELGKPFAFLLPLTALEGIKRGEMFRKNGMGIVVLDQRIDFNGKGNCWYNTSWFIHTPLTDGRVFFEKTKED